MFLTLYAADSTVFRWVNRTTANSVFDAVMPFITEPHSIPLYVLLLGLIVLAFRSSWRNTLWCLLLVAVVVTIGDRVNSSLLKSWVDRERPCRALEDVRLLRPCGGGKSFPSSHAVNITAAMIVASYFFRRFAPYGMGLAALICYSRVYVGVHYPADVLGGALVGAVLAGMVLVVWRAAMKRYNSRNAGEGGIPGYE